MKRSLPVVAFGVVILVAGVVNGLWTDRWHPAPEVREAASRLSQIPTRVGDWQGTDLSLTEDEVRAARLTGYCYRRYENVRNGHVVTLLVVCGRPGPISVHTPDVCFTGAGYKMGGAIVPCNVQYGMQGKEAVFHAVQMNSDESAFQSGIRVLWTWGAGGNWQTPSSPRYTFAKYPSLFKMYVIRSKTEEEVRPEDDPSLAFLRLMLPEVDTALFDTP